MNNLIIRFKYINKNSIFNFFFMFKISIFEIIFITFIYSFFLNKVIYMFLLSYYNW